MNRKDEIKQFVNEFNDALGIYNDENDRKYKIGKFKEEFNKDLEKAYETFYNTVKKIFINKQFKKYNFRKKKNLKKNKKK
jgi:hypothetical protein